MVRGRRKALASALAVTLCGALLAPGFAAAQTGKKKGAPGAPGARAGKTIPNLPAANGGAYYPTKSPVIVGAPVNFAQAAKQEALEPMALDTPSEIRAIHAPKGDRPEHGGAPIVLPEGQATTSAPDELAPAPSASGPSPGPTKSFKGEFLSSTSIPPDTMGAVGTTHIVTVSNDRMRIQDRNGVEISRATLSSFWAGITLEGGAAVSAFDPKVLYDRFNQRWILISSANSQSLSSAALFAVSQTNNPTGLWNRYAVDADPTATATGGLWIDYPTIGHNKNWIVVHENTFGYGTISGFQRSDVYVIDKQAAYANTLSTINQFSAAASTCTAPFEGKLGCGFTMAPTIVEDNTTEVAYLAEDWDSTAGQLRLSKLTGTASAPILTVGTQFPQSTFSWRFNAARIGTTGGYAPQRQQSAHLVSGTRIMNNDSRIQNAVLRNGSLWTAHTVMLAATPTPAGVSVGTAANPDVHSGVQWWQIDPSIETGLATPPIQRARIEDPTADNCHNGSSGVRTVGTCTSTATQVGQFYAFPNISVNQNGDMFLGFTQFSSLTYPSAAYAVRLSTDAANTTRDPVVYRPGQANYNLGSGTGGTTARQNRWGDYSAAQTDPLNDTDFWTVQEYAGTVRDFGIGLAGNWETYWANVKPATAAPSPAGNLVISEFRLRGPQGVRDEYVEVYNPGSTPIIVNTTDNSEGWSLAFSTNGTTATGVAVIPNGTVIPAKGHFLIVDNPDGATAPTLVYSLNGYPNTLVRGSDSDTGWSFDLADNGGLALFKTSTVANFTAANRMDAVGFNSIAAGLFKEGNGIPAYTVAAPAGQFTFYRDLTTGTPRDTDTNENDFVFVDPAVETFGVTPRLGAAGPKNLDSAIVTSTVKSGYIDPGCVTTVVNPASPTACERERNSAPVTNGAAGTLSIRRKFTNSTGANVTRLRFRVVDITTLNSPGYSAGGGQADLRLLSSPFIASASLSGGGTTSIQGLTLEEPPTQTNGGGYNSTVSAGIITLSAPLAPTSSINVNFLLGVQQGGNFRFIVVVEALP